MIIWFLTGIWHALLGLVLLVGALSGAVFVIGRALGQGQFTDHDEARCQCPRCTQKRHRSWQRHKERHGTPVPLVKMGMISTEGLQSGDRVEAKGVTYEITSLVGSDYGIQVFMTNMGNGRKSMVMVRKERVGAKFWKLAN